MRFSSVGGRSLALVAVSALVIVCAGTMQAQVAGNVFTTDSQGSVNVNLYNNKNDVYVNGGPRQPGAAGLPDGDYYIQVTEPNGVLLGSSVLRPNQTPITVVNGSFVTNYRLVDIVGRVSHPNHNPGFDDSSNPGNVYKVWVSKNPAFPSSESKTDSFKVRKGPPPGPQTTITVYKFYDVSMDGIWDQGENGLPEWRIELRTAGGALIDTQETDGGGKVQWIVPMDNTVYKLVELFPVPVPGHDWIATTATEFEVTADQAEVYREFGNVAVIFTEHTGLGRTKGFWQNQNGEALLAVCPDWWIGLNGLGLVNPDGSPFQIQANNHQDAYIEFSNWIVGNAALGNKKFILSTHLAALWLNVHCGPMSHLNNVWVNPNVEELFDEAGELLDDPDAVEGEVEDMADLFDDVNNNRRPVYEADAIATPPTFEY
jgi:hypothetical protein